MSSLRVTLLALGLVGCAIPEEDFAETYARTACDRVEECDKGSYESRYDDDLECQEQWADWADLLMDAADLLGGEYDEEAARECISAMKDADCGDFETLDYECDVYDY
jgi:hypothetical protein